MSYEISAELRIGESPKNAGRKPVSWIFGFGINAKSLTEARIEELRISPHLSRSDARNHHAGAGGGCGPARCARAARVVREHEIRNARHDLGAETRSVEHAIMTH